MTTLHDCITVTFTYIRQPVPTPETTSDQVELRRRFWAPLNSMFSGGSTFEGFDALAWEQFFNRDFGRNLREALINQMRHSLPPEDGANIPGVAHRFDDLLLVTFKARVVSYSSMEALITVGGVENLAKVFSDNFESCMIMLESVIEPALNETFLGNPGFSEVLRYDVRGNNALASQFSNTKKSQSESAENAAVASAQKEDPLVARARKIWTLIQLSFIVPVLLALLITYVAFNGMNAARERQEALMATNVALQAQLLQDALSRERLQVQSPTPTAAPTPTP